MIKMYVSCLHLYNPSECVEALETMTVSNQSGESDELVLWDPTGFVVAPSRIRLKQFDNVFMMKSIAQPETVQTVEVGKNYCL